MSISATQPLAIGSRREIFVDHLLIDRLDNTHLKLHEPVSAGVAIRIDKPWEGPGNFGISVIDSGDRLLMYYRGWPPAKANENWEGASKTPARGLGKGRGRCLH